MITLVFIPPSIYTSIYNTSIYKYFILVFIPGYHNNITSLHTEEAFTHEDISELPKR